MSFCSLVASLVAYGAICENSLEVIRSKINRAAEQKGTKVLKATCDIDPQILSCREQVFSAPILHPAGAATNHSSS